MKALVVVIALGLIAVLVSCMRSSAPAGEAAVVVTFDDSVITVTSPDGTSESVRWSELTRVGIKTTDEGPWVPDVFWVLHADERKSGAVYPSGATGNEKMLEAMEARLLGFRDKDVIRAMGSTSNAYFPVWERGNASQSP